MAKRRRACDSDVAGNDESGDGAQCGCGLARPGREIRPPLAARRVPRNGGPPATRSPRHTSDAILKESTETHIDPMPLPQAWKWGLGFKFTGSLRFLGELSAERTVDEGKYGHRVASRAP